jgi:hypothetical protein
MRRVPLPDVDYRGRSASLQLQRHAATAHLPGVWECSPRALEQIKRPRPAPGHNPIEISIYRCACNRRRRAKREISV